MGKEKEKKKEYQLQETERSEKSQSSSSSVNNFWYETAKTDGVDVIEKVYSSKAQLYPNKVKGLGRSLYAGQYMKK